jgi:hypothetical protein
LIQRNAARSGIPYEYCMRIAALPALVLAGLLSLAAPAGAQQRPAPGEVVDAVAQYMGLTNDAVSLALKDNAAALGRLTDAVSALQIAQQFLDARDAEIATTVLNQATDSAAEALLPPPLMTAIKAMRLYKTILVVVVHNKIVIPKLDRRLYETYRSLRENPTTSADRVLAFDTATQITYSGYYPVWVKMVDDYYAETLKSEPNNPRARSRAETRISDLWRERLEATYQQEKAKPQKQAILAAIWASVKDITDQLKAPAGGINAGLFPDPGADLPAGWWWARSAGAEYKAPEAYAPSHTPMWMQTVELSTVQGYVFKPSKGGGGSWCQPERNGKCYLPFQRIFITISDWTVNGGEKSCVLSLQGMLKDFPALYKRLSDRAISSVGQNPEQNGIKFCLQNFSVSLNDIALNGASPDPAVTRHFANVIVRKINAQIKGQTRVGTE